MWAELNVASASGTQKGNFVSADASGFCVQNKPGAGVSLWPVSLLDTASL